MNRYILVFAVLMLAGGCVVGDGNLWTNITYDTDFRHNVTFFSGYGTHFLDGNSSFKGNLWWYLNSTLCSDGRNLIYIRYNFSVKSCRGYSPMQSGDIAEYIFTEDKSVDCMGLGGGVLNCYNDIDCYMSTGNSWRYCCLNSTLYNTNLQPLQILLYKYSDGNFNKSIFLEGDNSIALDELPCGGDGRCVGEFNGYRLKDDMHYDYGCGGVTTTTTVTTTSTTLPNCGIRIITHSQGGTNPILANVSVGITAFSGAAQSKTSNSSGEVVFANIPCDHYDLYATKLPTYPLKKYVSGLWLNNQNLDIYLDNPSGGGGGDCLFTAINVTVNSYDYGPLNMNQNVVNLHGCYNAADCIDEAGGFCKHKHPMKYTDAVGYVRWEDVSMDNSVICLHSRITDMDLGITKNIYIPKTVISGEMEFNVSYGLSNISEELCLLAWNEIERVVIPDVDVSLTQGGLVRYSGKTDANGKFCFNTTGISNLNYFVQANILYYKPYAKSIDLVFGDTYLIMERVGDISAEFYHTVSGYVLEGIIKKNDIKVKSSCIQPYAYSDENGTYSFGHIKRGTNCCFEIVDVGYDSNKPCTTVNRNLTNVNITITKKDAEIYDVKITVVEPSIYQDEVLLVKDAHVEIEYNGEITPCMTGLLGFCNLPGVSYNDKYIVRITKDGYNPYISSIVMTDSEYQLMIYPEGGAYCAISGKVEGDNNTGVTYPISVDVELYDEAGNLIKTNPSDSTGYNFDVKCNKKYTLKLHCVGDEQSVDIMVPGGEGASMKKNFICHVIGEKDEKDIANLVQFVRDWYIPGAYLLFILFGLIVLRMALKALGI